MHTRTPTQIHPPTYTTTFSLTKTRTHPYSPPPHTYTHTLKTHPITHRRHATTCPIGSKCEHLNSLWGVFRALVCASYRCGGGECCVHVGMLYTTKISTTTSIYHHHTLYIPPLTLPHSTTHHHTLHLPPQAAAENIPEPDNTYDIVFSVYLFHELPPEVRRKVAGQMARCCKPGRCVYVCCV